MVQARVAKKLLNVTLISKVDTYCIIVMFSVALAAVRAMNSFILWIHLYKKMNFI